MDDKVKVLTINQVQDAAKGSFYIGLETTKERHRGEIVYKDKFGQRVVIVDGTV